MFGKQMVTPSIGSITRFGSRRGLRLLLATLGVGVAGLLALASAPAGAQTAEGPDFSVSFQLQSRPVMASTVDGKAVKLGIYNTSGTRYLIWFGATGERVFSVMPGPGYDTTLAEYSPKEYESNNGPVPNPIPTGETRDCPEEPQPSPSVAAVGSYLDVCYTRELDVRTSPPGLWGVVAPRVAKDSDDKEVVFHDWEINGGLVDGFCGAGVVGFTDPVHWETGQPYDDYGLGFINNDLGAWAYRGGIEARSWIDVWQGSTQPYGSGDPVTYAVKYAPRFPDQSKPILRMDAPRDCARLKVGQELNASYSCEDLGVGMASCVGTVPNGTPLDTSKAGVHHFTVTGTDLDGRERSRTVRYFVESDNDPPVITGFTTPSAPVAVGAPIDLAATFTDPDAADTHTASFSLDALSGAGTVSEANGSGSAAKSFTVTTPGVYTAKVTITDREGASDSATAELPVVVYDPSGGFVTGGGWFDSPTGAYRPDPQSSDVARFGFVSKYHKGATTPSGTTEFYLQSGELAFASTSYDWLVIAGTRAQYKGQGTVTGTGAHDGTYKFLLTAVDGTPDLLRMKIYNDTSVLYDNMQGSADDAAPTTALGGGSIIVHTPKK